MLAAEQGKPYRPLDRSVQPPPEDELIASGSRWDGSDDERLGRPPELPSEEQQQPQHHHRGGLLGWLFGDSGDQDDAPAPPARADQGH
jgi:hypothetical protein